MLFMPLLNKFSGWARHVLNKTIHRGKPTFGLSVRAREVKAFGEARHGLYGVEMSRVSSYLLAQLAEAYYRRTINSYSITDVLQSLEGCGRPHLAKGAEKFEHFPLNRFSKIHFFDARFMMKNLQFENGLLKKRPKRLNALRAEAMREDNENPSKYGWVGRLSNKLTYGAYTNRASEQRLTGEWIIFGEFEEKKYYLGWFEHSDNSTGDQKIYSTLRRSCKTEFPFLFT
jgi:hypothetical protein